MDTPVIETAAPEQASPQTAPPPVPPAPLASRIADTFFTPTRVFEQFRDNPAAPWLGPVFVSVAVLLVMAALRPLFISNQQIGDFIAQKTAEAGRPVPPADQMQKVVMVQMVVGTLVYSLWLFLRPLVFGGIVAAIFGLLMGGRAPFRGYLAVASHALLVSTLGFIVVGALQFATGRLDLALDASLLLGPGARGILASVLRAITPFSLWLIALLAIGGATLNRKRGWMGAASVLLGLQLVLALAWGALMQVIQGKAAG
jgi:hypothetical protein